MLTMIARSLLSQVSRIVGYYSQNLPLNLSALLGSAESPDKFDTFEKWLLANNTHIPKLELKVLTIMNLYISDESLNYCFVQDYGDEMRGCHTREDIEEDEVIIEIPLKCLITVEMGKDTAVSNCTPQNILICILPHFRRLGEQSSTPELIQTRQNIYF